MARRVLLVDSDVDALGELAAVLRTRGFTVLLAGDATSAVERARSDAPDIVLAAQALEETEQLIQQLEAQPDLARVPCIVLLAGNSEAPPQEGYARRTDVDQLTGLIVSVPPRSVPAEASQGEVRGDLSQVPLVDLLQVLSMNRRTGVLSVTTSTGAGEVRIVEGQVFDAVYRRLDGEKALFRMLSESDGTFAFLPGQATALRRFETGTSLIVLEAMRQADEVARLRAELAPGGDAIIASHSWPTEASKSETTLLEFLQVPRSLDEVLDELHAPDLELLETMHRLSEQGLLRRIPRAALMSRLAGDDKMQVLRVLVGRLARDGFSGPPRIAIAAAPPTIAKLAGAILRIEDALPPHDQAPPLPVPRTLATMRFGESVELAVIGLPLSDALAPVWPMTLAGTGAVVRLDSFECPEFDAVCASSEIPVLHADALLGEVEAADPVQVAALLRTALEAATGG